jgi:hypothetical protein
MSAAFLTGIISLAYKKKKKVTIIAAQCHSKSDSEIVCDMWMVCIIVFEVNPFQSITTNVYFDPLVKDWP